MRGRDQRSGNLFSYVDLEERVPDDHPLRLIREIVNDVLGSLSSEFETLYSHMGRPSIPPEKLLRALLLQAFDSIRSERQLMEQLNFNMLFRWFVGLGLDDGVWDASAFCHNRDRLLEAEVFGAAACGGYPAPQGTGTIEPGSFFGRRNIDRGLGVDEELSSQRWGRWRRGIGAQRRAGFSWRETLERDPCKHR